MSPTPNDYSRVNFSNSPKSEYGQVNPSDTYPASPSELVPTPAIRNCSFRATKEHPGSDGQRNG
jgi:hypothetical protein